MGCLKKIYSSEKIDNIIGEFKEYYHAQKTGAPSENIKQNNIEITDKRKFKYIIAMFVACAVLCLFLVYLDKNKKQNTNLIRSELPLPNESFLLQRPLLIQKMKNIFNKQGEIPIIVLAGIGGIGKTTLARQYARLQKAPIAWEFNAETSKKFFESLIDFAHLLAGSNNGNEILTAILNLENEELKQKKIFHFIRDSLKTYSEWCLIYDNVKDLESIKTYIPQDKKAWGNGQLIITTRNENIKYVSYIDPENIINIDNLSNLETYTLFGRILFNNNFKQITLETKSEIEEFLKKISPFPLDISIAASYIKNRKISFNQYLKEISQYNKTTEEIQKELLRLSNYYTNTRYGIVSSAFKYIIDINSDFKDLLFLICLIDSQNIPKAFLENFGNTQITKKFIDHLRGNGLGEMA